MSDHTPSTSVPAWQSQFDERIKAFAEALGIEVPKVLEGLDELGIDGKTSQSLDLIDSEEFSPMGDLRKAFVDSGLTKIAKLRSGMPHLRGSTRLDTVAASDSPNGMDKVANAIQDMVANNRPKSDWKDRELLEAYEEDAIEIIEILGKKSKGRPCIVFERNGSVNVTVSLELLREAKKRKTNDRHLVDGKPVEVFRVGEFLSAPTEESPLCMEETLLDGYCAKSNTSWKDIGMKYRILVRVYVQHVSNTRIGIAEMKKLWKEAKYLSDRNLDIGDITIDDAELLVEAVSKYERLEAQDQLPKLKVYPQFGRPERYTGRVDTGFGTNGDQS